MLQTTGSESTKNLRGKEDGYNEECNRNSAKKTEDPKKQEFTKELKFVLNVFLINY